MSIRMSALLFLVVLYILLYCPLALASHIKPIEGGTYWIKVDRGSVWHHNLGGARSFKIIDLKEDYLKLQLPSGETVEVRKWIIDEALEFHWVVDDPLEEQWEKERKEWLAAEKKRIEAAKKRAETGQKRVEQIKSKRWPSHIEKAVIERRIILGMTAEQAKMALGDPQGVNRNVGPWGVHEQWVYRGGAYLLYFENGKLTSWQESR